MYPFPHHYVVSATNDGAPDITLSSAGLSSMPSAAPPEFDGPGGRWSPETLIVAAVADCFVLTFRTMARASNLDWVTLECRVDGTVDRVDRVIQFTEFRVHVRLALREASFAVDEAKAARVLHKAHDGCLVSNSLKGVKHFDIEVVRGG